MNLLASIRQDVNKKKTSGTPEIKKTQIPVKIKSQVTANQKNVRNVKKTESPARLSYKSLQGALNSLNVNELQDLLDATWIQFKNDVIMLKTALTFLNEKLRLEKPEDSLFFDKPLEYPNNVLPNDLKVILRMLISKCSKEHLIHYFHNVLQSLCDELNRSRNFIGHLIILQQIAQHYPEVCTSNLASTVILRNSYQNQPSICLSLFWALGSSGISDTTTGLKVWTEIFSSVINVKSYTKFVFDYLQKILIVSKHTPALQISLDEYQSIVEILLSNDAKNKTKDLQKIKAKCLEMLTDKFAKSFNSDIARIESFFLLLLKFTKTHQEIFVREAAKCIALYPEETLKIWRLNITNRDFSKVNILILNYIGKF